MSERRPRFVVQQHDATRLHYDLRLEVEGVLRSWAVPKGPSLDPRDRRLAMAVEDHALDYGDFEGVLPEPRTGSGAVILWDRGTYRTLAGPDGRPTDASEALAAGHLPVELEGSKLRGGWALTRVAVEPRERWILVKMRDAHAAAGSDLVVDRPESVLSGRTVHDLAAASREPADQSSTTGKPAAASEVRTASRTPGTASS